MSAVDDALDAGDHMSAARAFNAIWGHMGPITDPNAVAMPVRSFLDLA